MANKTMPPPATTWSENSAKPKPAGRLRKLLDQPLVGFAPWIVLGLVEGPHRLTLAAALACALAVTTIIAGLSVSIRPKLLDITGIVFFGALTAWAAHAQPGTTRWLGTWSGELSNLAIALITVLSLVAHRPFTLQYARETTDPAYWSTPLFLRINYVITAVWAAVFVVIAYIGFRPLHQPDSQWTAWLIQIGLIVLAVKFTNWYPNHATAHVTSPTSQRRSRAAHHADLLRPLTGYLMAVGIVVMVIGGSAWWVGAVLPVVGIIITRKLRQTAQADAPSGAADESNPS